MPVDHRDSFPLRALSGGSTSVTPEKGSDHAVTRQSWERGGSAGSQYLLQSRFYSLTAHRRLRPFIHVFLSFLFSGLTAVYNSGLTAGQNYLNSQNLNDYTDVFVTWQGVTSSTQTQLDVIHKTF